MKDNFSEQAAGYARFRPHYPRALYEAIFPLVPRFQRAWDCGTGNGQVALELAGRFKEVEATDLSEKQIRNASAHEHISYSVQAAEEATFPRGYFDLITVAQAIHWFDFGRFYAAVNRVLRTDGLLAVFGYNLPEVEGRAGDAVRYFYREVVGPYWDPERRYIDEAYLTIPFPFEEIPFPPLEMAYHWNFHQLAGYLKTWSAVKHFERQQGYDPADHFMEELKTAWGEAGERIVRFPIIGRLGRL
ncbi:MAG: class I SAM-dependent methyltransferase [Lewinellaceae bacterium]|nr:class I SAM-dependent methyltransferase [Lewinellaceae bacterium]